MILLNENNNNLLTSVMLLLTPDEAKELRDKLKQIDPSQGDHVHINNKNFTKEITVVVYNLENLQFFGERIKKLVESEEESNQ